MDRQSGVTGCLFRGGKEKNKKKEEGHFRLEENEKVYSELNL